MHEGPEEKKSLETTAVDHDNALPKSAYGFRLGFVKTLETFWNLARLF